MRSNANKRGYHTLSVGGTAHIAKPVLTSIAPPAQSVMSPLEASGFLILNS